MNFPECVLNIRIDIDMTSTNKRAPNKHELSNSNKRTRKLWNKIDHSELRERNPLPPLCILSSDSVTDIKDLYVNAYKCQLCGSNMSIMDDGSNTCTSATCGAIGEYEVSMAPESNNAAGETDSSVDTTRYGATINPLLPESSFGCQIICRPGTSTEMKFMSRISNWGAVPSHEKMLYQEFEYISTVAQNAGIPMNIIEHAFIIHKSNSKQQLYRGKNRNGMKAGSIYVACILNGHPRTPQEIAKIFHLSIKNAMFGCTHAIAMIHRLKNTVHTSELGIGIDGLNFDMLTQIKPSHFIARYCSQLQFPADLIHLAKFISEIIESQPQKYSSKPQSIAGGILWHISSQLKIGISKSSIADICGVSEVTISNCNKWIQTNWPVLIPSVVLDQYATPHAITSTPPSVKSHKRNQLATK